MNTPVKRQSKRRSPLVGTPENPRAAANLAAEMRKADKLLRRLYGARAIDKKGKAA